MPQPHTKTPVFYKKIMKIKSNKIKNHKEKYRLERISRHFIKFQTFEGISKWSWQGHQCQQPKTPFDYINQFINLRLYETQCPQPQIPQ